MSSRPGRSSPYGLDYRPLRSCLDRFARPTPLCFGLCGPCTTDSASAGVLCHDQDCCHLWSILINLRSSTSNEGTFVYYNCVLDRQPSSHRRSRVEDGIYL